MTAVRLRDYSESIDVFLDRARQTIPTQILRMLVSEWAEQKRVLPQGYSPYPGPFSWDFFPFMREIADTMSDSSPVRECAVMKGTQIAATVGLGENVIGYKIDAAPGPLAYVSGSGKMIGKSMDTSIDAMLETAGVGHKIGSQYRRKGQRKTGDTKVQKEFPGGRMVAIAPRSAADMRGFSAQFGYADEIDNWPDMVGREGDAVELFRRRFDAYTESYKILWTSTPLIEQTSQIFRLFREGDQRRYFVPCKHCGEMQYLKWEQIKFKRTDDHRLVCTLDGDGNIIDSSVRYECEKCGGEWVDSDKDYFLPLGEWRATAESRRPGMRSYHVPGLLSPVGFRAWEYGVIQFLDIIRKGKPKHELQNWTNTFLGEAFVDQGEKPKIEAILTRERDYHRGSLPRGARPLLVTIGADVQIDRVEFEIVAWGKNAESWSVDYRVAEGDTADLDGSCYDELRRAIVAKYSGIQPVLSGIDAGYRTDVIYQFADSFEGGVHPTMGFDTLGKGARYLRISNVDEAATARIDLNTDLLKQRVYEYLNRSRYEDGSVPVGYCHFPTEYNREHFSRLTAESRLLVNSGGSKKWKWDAGERRNEQLDCRVIALGMVHATKQYVEGELGIESGEMTWDDFWSWADENL